MLLKTLKETAAKLYPHFTPNYENYVRTIGFIFSVLVIPIVNYLIPKLFLSKEDRLQDNQNNFDIVNAFTAASIVGLITGAQSGLSTALVQSTSQSIMKRNTKLSMDESKFLIHGSNKSISSLQYVTVGVGVTNFAFTAVPIFVSLPMYSITLVGTIVNIGITTESFKTSLNVFSFVALSAAAIYGASKGLYFYTATNIKTQNDLVGKINFIEAHREAIGLIGTSKAECETVVQGLQKINASIPKLSLLDFFNAVAISLATAIASQFLGGYYKSDVIQSITDNNVKALNIMLMSLLTNTLNIVHILTGGYELTKLNLGQLDAFDKAYDDCMLIRKANNKMKLEFVSDHLSLSGFTVYKPNTEVAEYSEPAPIFQDLTIELLPNKIYKLVGSSGVGKTTFLKAITNNWQYTDGTVKLPIYAKDNICFIPQNSFIPQGTLLEILTYPLKPKEFLRSYNQGDFEIQCSFISLIQKVINMLITVKLLPTSIRANELETENINWNDRLSGGEKQKVGIVRALMTEARFIIMDESTASLDQENRLNLYSMIKNHIAQLEDYTVIYTEHGDTAGFADATLSIVGQSLECAYL